MLDQPEYVLEYRDGVLYKVTKTPVPPKTMTSILRNLKENINATLLLSADLNLYAIMAGDKCLGTVQRLDSIPLDVHLVPTTLNADTLITLWGSNQPNLSTYIAPTWGACIPGAVRRETPLIWTPPVESRLLFITHTATNSCYLLLVDHETGKAYRPPVANLYEDGRICLGTPRTRHPAIPAAIDMHNWYLDALRSGIYNHDLAGFMPPEPLCLWHPDSLEQMPISWDIHQQLLRVIALERLEPFLLPFVAPKRPATPPGVADSPW
jgi:hypothetical protein